MKPPFLTEDQLLNEFSASRIKITPLLEKALIQTKRTHRKHLRDDGTSSVLEQHIYPLVKSIISCYKYEQKKITTSVLAAGLLHDVIEDDYNMTDKKFKFMFGNKIYKIVKCVTKKPEENKPDLSEEEIYAINVKLVENLRKCPTEAQIIKLADRFNNVICSFSAKPKNIKKYKRRILETEEIFLPFAKEVSPFFYKKIGSVLNNSS